jgi:hypothetical protein
MHNACALFQKKKSTARLSRKRRMKFGSQLNSNIHQEWKFQYVDYDELKRLLKSAEEGTGFGGEF